MPSSGDTQTTGILQVFGLHYAARGDAAMAWIDGLPIKKGGSFHGKAEITRWTWEIPGEFSFDQTWGPNIELRRDPEVWQAGHV